MVVRRAVVSFAALAAIAAGGLSLTGDGSAVRPGGWGLPPRFEGQPGVVITVSRRGGSTSFEVEVRHEGPSDVTYTYPVDEEGRWRPMGFQERLAEGGVQVTVGEGATAPRPAPAAGPGPDIQYVGPPRPDPDEPSAPRNATAPDDPRDLGPTGVLEAGEEIRGVAEATPFIDEGLYDRRPATDAEVRRAPVVRVCIEDLVRFSPAEPDGRGPLAMGCVDLER